MNARIRLRFAIDIPRAFAPFARRSPNRLAGYLFSGGVRRAYVFSAPVSSPSPPAEGGEGWGEEGRLACRCGGASAIERPSPRSFLTWRGSAARALNTYPRSAGGTSAVRWHQSENGAPLDAALLVAARRYVFSAGFFSLSSRRGRRGLGRGVQSCLQVRQQLNAPLPGPLPVRSSRGEGVRFAR